MCPKQIINDMDKPVKCLAGILLTLSILFFCGNAFAVNRIFLLDTSSSIKKEGLFDKIKKNLQLNYVSEMKAGEHIILLTFDEKIVVVVDQKITAGDDIANVNKQIETLAANGRWTWMTRALQLTIEQAKRLKMQYPEEELKIYFLTDGINDPPPIANEPPLKFIELLEKYFQGSIIDDAYIYVFLYEENGKTTPLTKEQQEKLEKETKGRMKIGTRSRSFDAIPSEISVGYSGTDLGIINSRKGDIEMTFSIGIKELKGNVTGKIIDILSETDPSTQSISLRIVPDSFKVYKEGQIEKITIHIPQDISIGEYAPVLKLSSDDDVLISPSIIPISFKVVAKDNGKTQPTPQSDLQQYDWDLVQKLLIIFLFLTFLYFLLLILRRRSLWVQKNGQDDNHIQVKSMQKKRLDMVGLPNHYAVFGVLPQDMFSVLLFKNSKKVRKIVIDESVICQDEQGQNIVLIFRNKPLTTLPKKSTQDLKTTEDENPDFFIKDDKKNIDFL